MPRPPTALLRLLVPVLVAATALPLAACGAAGDAGRPDEAATLLLDLRPGAADAGIYQAVARDFTGAEGVRLRLRVPARATDALRFLGTGGARFAVLDINDLARARSRGADLVGVMAIVQSPLAALITQPGIASPRALAGRRAGVGDRPAGAAVLDAIVRADGGRPADVRHEPVGPGAVAAILEGRVAGATGFWSAEGMVVQARRPGTHVFRVDRYGAPAYPELVLVVPRTLTQDDPALVRATVTALQRGYRETIADPESAVGALVAAQPGADRTLVARQLGAVQPAFQSSSGRIGTLDPGGLRAWAAWARRARIVPRLPEVAQMFLPRFAAEGAAKAAQNSG